MLRTDIDEFFKNFLRCIILGFRLKILVASPPCIITKRKRQIGVVYAWCTERLLNCFKDGDLYCKIMGQLIATFLYDNEPY